MPWRRVSVAATALVTCVTLLDIVFDLAVDWAWFSALGYLDIFWTVFSTRASLFLTVFAATAFIVWLNGWLASQVTKPDDRPLPRTCTRSVCMRRCPQPFRTSRADDSLS